MPAYFHDTPIDVPDGSWVRFDSDSSGTPAAVFSRSGQPIVNSVVFSQTGSVPRVTSDAATLFVRLALQTGVARSGVVAQTSGVAFTSFDSDSDITGRGGPSGGTTDQTARDSVSTLAASLPGTYAPKPTPTATKTAAYTAAAGDLAVMNVAAGATVLTLPAAPADKTQVAYRATGATTAAPMTIARGGTDTIGTSGATTASIPLDGESGVLQYDAANTRWLGISNVKPQAALDQIYAQPTSVPVAVGGYASAQTAVQATVGTARVPYLVARACTDLRLLYSNWFTNGTVDNDNTADLVLSASVEIGGTIYRVLFGGSTTVTIKPGGSALSDPFPADLAAATTLYVRTFTSGTAWHANRYANAAGAGGWTVTTDLTAPGSAAIADNSSFTPLLGPATIFGTPAGAAGAPRMSILDVGDSIAYGQGDGPGNGPGVNTAVSQLGGGGWVGRAATAAGVGVLNIAVQTDTATSFAALLSRFRRMSLAAAGSTAVCAYGRNDVTNGRTLAQVQADLITAWTLLANRGKRVLQTTITPRAASTDGFLTAGAQTANGNDTVRQSLNGWLRDGAPMSAGAAVAVGTAGASRARVNDVTGALVTAASGAAHLLTGIVEVADAVESARNSGVWKAPTVTRTVTDGATTGASTGVTSATAAFTAADRGRTVVIPGAGTSGALYTGTILTVTNATTVQVLTAPATTVAGASLTVCEPYTQDGTHPQPAGALAMAAALPASLIG